MQSIDLNPREAALLSIAIRFLGGSYIKAKDEKEKSTVEKEKLDAYYKECRRLAHKIENTFEFKSATMVDDDGNGTLMFDKSGK